MTISCTPDPFSRSRFRRHPEGPRFKKRTGQSAVRCDRLPTRPTSLKWKPGPTTLGPWRRRPAVDGRLGVRAAHDRQHGPRKGRAASSVLATASSSVAPGSSYPPARPGRRPPGSRDRVAGESLLPTPTIPTAILVFRAPGTKAPERHVGVLFIRCLKRFSLIGQESQHPHRRRHCRRRDRLPLTIRRRR